MPRRLLVIVTAAITITGCSSDPDAPVNRTTPIRQMDRFFDTVTGRPPAPPDYTREPGYAPAYPPYQTD